MKIDQIREKYARIERIDPEGEGYQKLIAFLDGTDTKVLQILVDAKIKWVSSLAQNRITRRSMSTK